LLRTINSDGTVVVDTNTYLTGDTIWNYSANLLTPINNTNLSFQVGESAVATGTNAFAI